MGIFDFLKTKSNNSRSDSDELTILIKNAITVLENCSNYKSEDEIIKKINEYANNISLAWEMYCFIPVAYTRRIVKVSKYSDEAIITLSTGNKITKFLSEMAIYKSIQSVVSEKIKEGNNDKIEAILFQSSEFKAIHNAILQGSKMENLVLSPLMMFAPDGYNA